MDKNGSCFQKLIFFLSWCKNFDEENINNGSALARGKD